MSEQTSDTRPDQLQFDRAIESGAGAPDSTIAQIVCANCQAAIPSEYFAVGGNTICRLCRNTIGKEFELAA